MPYKLIENELTAKEYRALRSATGLGMVEEELAKRSIKNSLFTVKAVADKKNVGMGRVVGDDGFLYFIDSVAVLAEYANEGIADAIMEKLLAYIASRAPERSTVMIGVMASLGTEELYAKHGFRSRPNEFEGAGMVRFYTK